MGQRRSIQGWRILVTGASQGIGQSLATEAARRGARVLAVARSENLLHELCQQARSQGFGLDVLVGDVTSPQDSLAHAGRDHCVASAAWTSW